MLLPTLFPRNPTLSNYASLLGGEDFYRYFVNSVAIAVFSVAGNVLLCSMVGYALAKLSFPGKRLVLGAVLITIMVPGVVMFVPLFITVNGLGLSNSYGGMIVPFLVGAGGVFLFRQFLLDIPDELLEAARIDGAGEFRIFFRVVLPLCGPALATIGLLTFMSIWNNLLWPLVVAQSKELYTLPVALAFLSQGDGTINYGVMFAGSVLTIAPIVLVFLFLQRYFITGIATTGIK
ncbi:carbohydrate ABC transporter permease [Nonomuraea sp. NPDC050022]|uniref:carbohydrate ABC transporter permease n=1 Tax=unclassified Nonomuraea TaxID=2593643 RepID=UPI00340E9B15